jgi:ribosome-binding protein aMBF1 (putative translation factor)
LVALARRWSRLTIRELGKHLQRDPSMISRLAASYAASPNAKIESQIRRTIQLKLSR